MRYLMILVGVAWTWNAVLATNSTEHGSANKTKRGVVDQMHYYGDTNLIRYIQTPLYTDVASSAASNPQMAYYPSNQRPIIFHTPSASVKTITESEPPKQVTVQQVHYEYQQTPHNAVSNVHVNQQFQPLVSVTEQRHVPDAIHAQTSLFPSHTQINPHFVNQGQILHVEPNQFSGVATPVHHGAVVHHGQAKLLYGPFPVAPTTMAPLTHANGQPKYIYANGKILYQPLPMSHGSNLYAGVNPLARSHNLAAPNLGYPQRISVTQKPFKPSAVIPISYSRYQTHTKLPVKAAEIPIKEEVEEEPEEKSDVREEQDEDVESDDNASYEEGDEEEARPVQNSGKYKYVEDDDDDSENYKENDEEEEEENVRSHRHVKKNPKKRSKSDGKPVTRYRKNDHNSFKEGYKSSKKFSMEYKIPSSYFKYESSGKKPKSKSHKSHKTTNGKQKKEIIESRQSQHIPVKKLIQESGSSQRKVVLNKLGTI